MAVYHSDKQLCGHFHRIMVPKLGSTMSGQFSIQPVPFVKSCYYLMLFAHDAVVQFTWCNISAHLQAKLHSQNTLRISLLSYLFFAVGCDKIDVSWLVCQCEGHHWVLVLSILSYLPTERQVHISTTIPTSWLRHQNQANNSRTFYITCNDQ